MKRVFILGASQGIGLGLVKRFLEADYEVVASSRSGRIDAITHANLQVVALDITIPEHLSTLTTTLQQEGQQFDCLINNAGIGPDLNVDYPEQLSFRQTMTVNVEGIIFATEQLLPFLAPVAKVINVSSKMGSVSHCQGTTSVAYRISKAGLNMYSKILSNRLPAQQKVAVIHPGFVRTNISNLNDHAPLSPYESADRIYTFIQRNFETGTYWDCQEDVALSW